MKERLSLLAAMALVLVTAVPPMSALADGVCNSGEFCVWGGTGYTGDFWDPSGSDPDWPCCGGTGVQNDDDSLHNRESKRVVVYAENGYVSDLYCATDGLQDSNIADNRDNAGNSHVVHTTSTSCSGFASP